MNSWIKATPKEQPVFAWLAFTALMILQAPDEWIKRFKGQYEQGLRRGLSPAHRPPESAGNYP